MPEVFWEYTIMEIEDIINAKYEILKRERKQRISDNYALAGLIGTYYAKLWDDKDKVKIPHLWELYDTLFNEEKEAYEQEEIKKASNSRYNYAARYNQKFNKQKHTEDT